MVSVLLSVVSANSMHGICARLLARLSQRLAFDFSVTISAAVATASISAVAGFFSVSVSLPAPMMYEAAVTIAEVALVVKRMSTIHCAVDILLWVLQLRVNILQIGRRGQLFVGADDFQKTAHVLSRLRLDLSVLRQVRPASES